MGTSLFHDLTLKISLICSNLVLLYYFLCRTLLSMRLHACQEFTTDQYMFVGLSKEKGQHKHSSGRLVGCIFAKCEFSV